MKKLKRFWNYLFEEQQIELKRKYIVHYTLHYTPIEAILWSIVIIIIILFIWIF